MRSAFWFWFLALMPMEVFAQSPPFEIKGLQLGKTMAELADTWKQLGCDTDKSACFLSAVSLPGGRATFGPIQAKYFAFTFEGDSLGYGTVNFATEGFARISSALLEKYGPPTSDVTENIHNAMGAAFPNRIITWKRAEGTMLATQRHLSITDAQVTMMTPAYAAAAAKRQKEQAKSDAKAL